MGNLFDELRRVFPHVEPATCRKIGHLTSEEAEAQLASILRSPDCQGADTLRVYRCANCNQFHVGHRGKDDATLGEEVRDASGRNVAPAQTQNPERPRGPWDSNEG